MGIFTRRAIPLLLLCGFAAPVPAGDSADRAALDAAARAWIEAFNARDAEAMSRLATEDVVLLNSGAAPVVGRENARRAWLESLSWSGAPVTAVVKEASVAGNFAWTIVAYSGKTPAGTAESRGQSLEIWQRVEGRWKIHRHMAAGALVQGMLRPRPVPPGPVLDERTD